MKLRLQQTEAVANSYAPHQRYWVKHSLENVGRQVWKYKFNYGVKAFFIYRAYAEFRNLRHVTSTTIPDPNDLVQRSVRVLGWSGVAGALLLWI